MENRIFKALILNEPYAQWLKEGKKLIETRMKRFSHRGDLIICCDKGKSKNSPNSGKAICMVDLWKVRIMRDSDEQAACIENVHKRFAHLLKNWRHFSEDFNFVDNAVTRNWQGLFEIKIPDHIQIIPRPDIIPFREYLSPQEAYKLLKEDETFDYLDVLHNPLTDKFGVVIGGRLTPIEIFDTEDEAQMLVNKTHDILNKIQSARSLRSFIR